MASPVRSAVEVPVLETERLRLRRHRLEDFAACTAMWADPIVTRHIGGKPFSQEEVWTRLLRYVGHWAWLGFGYWALEEKASDEFIGAEVSHDQRLVFHPFTWRKSAAIESSSA